MKSRLLIAAAMVAIFSASSAKAQVLPIGRAPAKGQVQPASCTSCNSHHGGFYGGVIGGGSCETCNVHAGLFPPCPNPCRTTLLGELVYDIKLAIDSSLSHLFCCVAGDPGFACGCHGACACGGPSCGYAMSDCSTGDCGCGGTSEYEVMGPSTVQPGPTMSTQPDPFQDDPPSAQPVPTTTTKRSLLPRPKARAAVAGARRGPRVQRVSHEQVMGAGVATQRQKSIVAKASAEVTEASPVVPPEHYHPRRTTSLRRVNGNLLKRAPLRSDGSPPQLRFRDAN